VTAIRQDKTSPWVQFPTVKAMDSYTAHRQGGTKTAVPVASTEDGA
jgi:hypothetical protein